MVSDFSSDNPTSNVYEPLLGAAGPDLYRLNAFRVTGLPTSATAREVSRQLEKIRMMAKLGDTAGRPGGLLPLDPAPDEGVVQEAIRRLRDPGLRLIEEFFWFWPSAPGGGQDPALEALTRGDVRLAAEEWAGRNGDGIAVHNLAVLSHTAALDLERRGLSSTLSEKHARLRDLNWKAALRHWATLLGDEGFWSRLASHIRALDDPRLTTGMARRIRQSLPLALLSINARLAVSFAESQSSADVIRHVRLMRDSGLDESAADEALRRAVWPICERIKALCKAARAEAGSDPELAGGAARRLLEQARSPLGIVCRVLPSGDRTRGDIRDEVALASLACQISYGNETEDWETTLELSELTLPVAVSESAKVRIEESIKVLKGNIAGRELDKIYERVKALINGPYKPQRKFSIMKGEVLPKLEQMQSRLGAGEEACVVAADICARALRGISIDLHNNGEDFGAAYEAILLARKYCHDPELKSQVDEDTAVVKEHALRARAYAGNPGRETQGHTLGRKDNEADASLTVAKAGSGVPRRTVVGAAVALFVIANIVWLSSGSSPSTSNGNASAVKNSTASPTPQRYSNFNAPATARNTNTSRSKTNTNAVGRNNPITSVPSEPQPVYTEPNDPPTSSYEAGRLKGEIESARLRLSVMKSELTTLESRLDSYKSRIQSNAALIGQMESNARLGLEVDRSRYRRTMAEHNSDVDDYNSVLGTYRAKLAAYNALLDETNDKVRQYNQLMGAR